VNAAVFLLVAAGTVGVLLFAPFARRQLWRAAVTPLASIIGSGFLVSAPLLAHEFGGYAAIAIGLLIGVAALVGWAIRYNIAVVEGQLERGTEEDRALISIEKLSHVVLAFAYFISVTYYLTLLGHFVLAAAGVQNELLAEGIAMALLLFIGVVGFTGGAEKVAGIERYTTALNLGVIVGFLVALAFHVGELVSAGESVAPPPGRFEAGSVPVLLGLLIVVQGFETTRFTGDQFDAPTRARAMSVAQLISGVIYLCFFLLLSPLLDALGNDSGVSAIITLSVVVSALLPVGLTVAAAASQFSASVADSLGDAGLIEEITGGRVDPAHAYPMISAIGIGLLWATDVNGIIALASRAFALFYALQCLVAFESARKRPGERAMSLGFLTLALITTAVFVFGVPAGG
jgi:hypothetical protein